MDDTTIDIDKKYDAIVTLKDDEIVHTFGILSAEKRGALKNMKIHYKDGMLPVYDLVFKNKMTQQYEDSAFSGVTTTMAHQVADFVASMVALGPQQLNTVDSKVTTYLTTRELWTGVPDTVESAISTPASSATHVAQPLLMHENSETNVFKGHSSPTSIKHALFQIALSFEVAKAIVQGDAARFRVVIFLVRRFFEPTHKKWLTVDINSTQGPLIPLDGFLEHRTPTNTMAGQWLWDNYRLQIRCDAFGYFEAMSAAVDTAPAAGMIVLDESKWQFVSTKPRPPEEPVEDIITAQGLQIQALYVPITLVLLFLICIVGVIVANSNHREYLDQAGIDPTSLLSLLFVILGMVATVLKAALVKEWAWYDFARGRFYSKRLSYRRHVQHAMDNAHLAPRAQRKFLSSINGFSYIMGSKPDGIITTKRAVQSIDLLDYGILVLRLPNDEFALLSPLPQKWVSTRLKHIGHAYIVDSDRTHPIGMPFTHSQSVPLR
ncbi:hypothetical protein BC940DRAFT_312204 [Gongronella butleri]|nr:hypothetical protein BC940DRAFT_312204 [Gongronella butleri]